jgi:Flp pilus assembly protein TadG
MMTAVAPHLFGHISPLTSGLAVTDTYLGDMFRDLSPLSLRARIRARRARGERGAVAIEAAILTPLLILLIFGIIEFGMLFKDWLAVTSSVRAGTRMASAEPRVMTFAQDAADQVAREGSALDMANVQELWIYKAQTSGSNAGYPVGGDSSFSNCTTCVKFHWNAGTKTFVAYSNTWAATAQNACQGDASHDAIGVYLKILHPGVTGLIFGDMTIKEHSVMSLEPIPTTKTCK